ncbi:MAG TPA: TRAP transporter small permease [Paenalcaligenes sp.]|nr:TRAP transporter small permease [Paenalcaligenes sp.]
MIDRYIALVERLSRWGGALAVACLVFAMVVVCQMILTRYVFRGATVWQTEAVVFSATAAIFIGAPYVLLRKGHVGVDVVMHYASTRNQRRLEFIGALLGLLFCLVMAIATGVHWYEAYDRGWTTPSVAAVPLWWPLTPMFIGFVLLSLQYLANLFRICRNDEVHP